MNRVGNYYIQKPEMVEAIRAVDNYEILKLFCDYINYADNRSNIYNIVVPSLPKGIDVAYGDWIIKRGDGTFEVYSDQIFRAMFDSCSIQGMTQ